MQAYTDEIKAAVIADAALGMSKSAIARKHKIPRTTVIAWVASHEPPLPTVSDTKQREDLGALIYEYLTAGLQALISQSRIMGEPEWFKGQGETAHLIHGVLADKLVVIFAGVERGKEPDSDNPG